jgi:hypothetical protein
MATAQQIREQAATKLQILGEGETLESYEVADLNQAYTEVYAELQAINLAAWDEASDVPDQYANYVASLVADQRARNYQVPADRYQLIRAEGWGFNLDGVSIKRIRTLQSRAKQGVTEIESF